MIYFINSKYYRKIIGFLFNLKIRKKLCNKVDTNLYLINLEN